MSNEQEQQHNGFPLHEEVAHDAVEQQQAQEPQGGEQQQEQQQQPAVAGELMAQLAGDPLAELFLELDSDEWAAEGMADEDEEEEDLDQWDEEEDAMDEVPFLASGSEEEVDEDDFMEIAFDDEEEQLSAKHRVQLECGLLQHDASLLLSQEPTRHTGVKSAAHHHQTADALTYLPALAPPDTGAAAAGSITAAGAGAVEDVLVSCKGTLSIYRLAAGQPAQLLARHGTLFKHYSVAASPCGNYVAATGNGGLLTLFRVQRSNPAKADKAAGSSCADRSGTQQEGAQSTAAASGPAAAASAGAEAGGAASGVDEVGAEVGPLDWELVHVATVVCKHGSEVMVNSVRFGNFAGRLRMLVGHQDGMLYLFNLPDQQQQPPPAATSQPGPPVASPAVRAGAGAAVAAAAGEAAAPGTAAAAPGTAAAAPTPAQVRAEARAAPTPARLMAADRTAALSQAGEAAALMVTQVPDWEPLGSQINRRYVEQLLALLPPQQHSTTSQQQQQQQGAAPAGGTQDTAAGAAAEATTAGAGAEAAATGGCMTSASADTPGTASRSLTPSQQPTPTQPLDQQQPVSPRECGHSPEPDSALAQAQGPYLQHDEPAAAAGSLRHALQAINGAEQVLGVLVSWMRDNQRCPGVEHYLPFSRAIMRQQEQVRRIARQDSCKGGRFQLHTQPLVPPMSGGRHRGYDGLMTYVTWGAKAQTAGQLLQDEAVLKELRVLEHNRLSYHSVDEWVVQPHKLEAARSWATAVDALRAAAAGQWALLGALGTQQQQEQWQRQEAEGDGDRQAAVARAVYLLLLLRLLGPIAAPSIKQGAKVLVLRHGPQVANRRMTAAEITGAPRLTTCAITHISRDDKAAVMAAADLAQAQAHLDVVMQAAAGVGPEEQGAAAIAAEQAARVAAQEHLLPLNIVEASPDGQWLAVGADQLAVVLLPAGAGYQHQVCHVLDLCPLVGPRHSTAWYMSQGTLGCQYLSFNSSSTLLAASCDALRLVVVWSAAGPSLGQRLAAFSLHNRAVLPVRFMPPAHLLSALQQGMAAAAAAVEEAAGGVRTAAGGDEGVVRAAAAAVLQLHAGPRAAASGVGAGGVLGAGGITTLRDGLLTYCELFCGVHVVDLSVFTHTTSPGPPCPSNAHPTSTHFCIKHYLELSPRREQQQSTAAAATAGLGEVGAAGDAQLPPAASAAVQQSHQQQQQQQGDDAVMAEAPPVPPAAAAAAALGSAFSGVSAGASAQCSPAGAVSAAVVYDTNRAPRINGLVVTPGGRLLVAVPAELLEWQLLTQWSHSSHCRFPTAFKATIKALLLAAAPQHTPTHHQHNNNGEDDIASSSSSNTSSGSSSREQLLLARLPVPVLEQVIAAAALPQGSWAAAVAPSYTQLFEALTRRPGPPHDAGVNFGVGWPELLAAAGQGGFVLGPG